MGASVTKLRFKWTSWLRRLGVRRLRRSSTLRVDEGLSCWCVEMANALQLPRLARKVKVRWNPRMQTTAGRAIWPDGMIELNPKLRAVAGEDALWRILRHELAHLVAYERSSRRRIAPHGPEWQLACVDLGIGGEQPYHDLPFAARTLRRNYVYACRHCESTIRRVRPIRGSVACFKCCRKYNQGLYHERYRMIRRLPAA